MIKPLFKRVFPVILPGIISGVLFLVYTLAFNVSLSYMGNDVSNVVSLVLNNFMGALTVIVFKIVIAYLILFSILSLFFYYAIKGVSDFFARNWSHRKISILATCAIIGYSILTLFKDLIIHPQMYVESFYQKNQVYAFIQEALTNNVHPVVFTLIQTLVILAGLFFIAQRILAHKMIPFRKIAISGIIHRKKIFALCAILVITLSTSSLMSLLKKEPTQRNVLILASDALRQDHFGINGYPRSATPSMDKLIRQGAYYANVYTVIPRTFPSWVSILTSQYPETHTIRNMFPSSANRNIALETVPSILKEKGYRTAVVGDFAADIFPRIELGFDSVRAPTFNTPVLIEQIFIKDNLFVIPYLTGRAGITIFPSIREFAEFADSRFSREDLIDEIDTARREKKPFFITSFFSITHFPYSAPWPYYNLFTDKHFTGPSKYMKNRLVSLGKIDDSISQMPSKDEIAHVRALYDGGLKGFDDTVAVVIDHLKRKGLLDNTLIVILSDHGENLYEFDNGMGHGEHLRGHYSLKIPLALIGKDIPPKISNEMRSTIDIAPTILEYLGIPKPQSFEGDSLGKKKTRPFDAYTETGLWFDTSGNYFFQKKRFIYPDITGLSNLEFRYHGEVIVKKSYHNFTNDVKHRAIIRGDYKLIYMPIWGGVEYELYNIRKDPDEQKNIAGSMPKEVAKMKKLLFGTLANNPYITIKNDFIISKPDPAE